MKSNTVFQEEVPTQVSDIQCSKRTKTIAEDTINISETYDEECDINIIQTKTQVHVPDVMIIADDSPLRESYASKINENNAAVASGLIPISSIKREAKKGNRRSVSDVTTAYHVERADEKAVATSNISKRNRIMSSFDEIKVEYPRKVMFYRVRKLKQLPSEELDKKIKKEKKKKANVIAQFDDTTFILSDNEDAASELQDEENYQFLLEGAYDCNGEPFSCTNSGAKGKSLVQVACDRSTALRVAIDAVSASSGMFSSNVPPRRHVYDGTVNLEQLHQDTLLEDLDKNELVAITL